jgi:hypothetical protein
MNPSPTKAGISPISCLVDRDKPFPCEQPALDKGAIKAVGVFFSERVPFPSNNWNNFSQSITLIIPFRMVSLSLFATNLLK